MSVHLGKDLSLVNVIKALSTVPMDKHEDVGLALGVEFEQIKEFEANHPRNINRVWKEIISCWLNSSSTHTWTTLAQLLLDNGMSHFVKHFANLWIIFHCQYEPMYFILCVWLEIRKYIIYKL